MSTPSWRKPPTKPENHRLVFILLAIIAVAPILGIVLADGMDSNLLPRMVVFSISMAAFIAAIQWYKMRREQGQGND